LPSPLRWLPHTASHGCLTASFDDEDHHQSLPRRRHVALEPQARLDRGSANSRRRGRSGRRGRRRRRGRRLWDLSSRVRWLLSRLQGPGRRVSPDLGRVHTRLPHALLDEVARHGELEAAVPDGPQALGHRRHRRLRTSSFRPSRRSSRPERRTAA
ncbi:hypothetical protein AAT19DRAFT_10041, partial [Rhodotorula toruloides]